MTATSTVDCKHDGNVRTLLYCIARSNNKKLWFIARKERKIASSNNQPTFYVALQEQAAIAKQQHHQHTMINL
jgi:hypothetical protein